MKSSALLWLRTSASSNLAKKGGAVAGVAIALAAVVLLVFPRSLALLGLGKSVTEQSDSHEAESLGSVVKLSERHAQEVGLKLGRVSRESLQHSHAVPGKVVYHASRQLELKAPVECVVKHVLVEVGSKVNKGDKLAVLTSAEIGLARDQVLKCEADLKLAQVDADWTREIDENLQALLVELKQQPNIKLVESRFEEKVLGDYRDKVLSAYSKLIFASLATTSTDSLQDQGVLAGRLAQERRSTREVQAAQFQSICETSRFESRQHRERDLAVLEQARRMHEVSRERLLSLLGPFSDDAEPASGESLSEFAVRAPLAGRIEERSIVESARVMVGQPLFSLANTDVLWVSAEIHERNWNALTLIEGRDLTVRSPALPGREFTAQVRFSGSKVSEETRSVPLVAELANPEGLFKPGMFLWVSVPVEEPRSVLAVRPTAVVRHESQSFVFVPDGPETFRRIDVTTGLETSDWVEISSGLKAGETVVEQGATLLKSELLLPTLEE